MKIASITSNEWIAQIKNGDRAALDRVYTTYRDEFITWMRFSYSCSENDALDVFQDSVIVLYRQIMSGKIVELKSSLKTYLFGVAKRVWLDRNKRQKIKTNDIENYHHLQTNEMAVTEQLNERQLVMKELLSKLREPCRSIIHLFYYRKFSLESIAQEMNYSSKDVAKAQKVRCMKGFRKVVTKQYSQGEI